MAPFRNQAREIAWAYLKHYSAALPGREVNESTLSVTVPGGARVRIFGADNPDALRGLYFDGVVLDEVAQMKPELWGEIIRPALADRMGRALFIGTPKGVNMFPELYEHARREEAAGNTDWAALRFRVDETKALPASEVARLRREMGDTAWRQEMLCDFTAASDDALIPIDSVSEGGKPGHKPGGGGGRARGGGGGRGPLRLGRHGVHTATRPGGLCAGGAARSGATWPWPTAWPCLWTSTGPTRCSSTRAAGRGVIDRLRRLGRDVIEAPFGARALNDARFVNRRAEMWRAVR